ncbi:MAG: DUF1223 domain-containing protein [Alphaproteobacteria bacterium]
MKSTITIHRFVLGFGLGLLLALGVGFAVVAAGPARAEVPSDPNLVVVELFTSQGCSSCPPADAFLGELAKRSDVLALSLHVDYWNYIGWPDPFSSPAMTARQRAYSQSLGHRYVYTPQMVIDGKFQEVGSRTAKVERAIAGAKRQAPSKLRIKVVSKGAGKAVVRIPASKSSATATVWLVGFDNLHTTPITSGENSGRTISYHNVVRAIRPIGSWGGNATEISFDITHQGDAEFDNCAIIVQRGRAGPILGAVALPMSSLR